LAGIVGPANHPIARSATRLIYRAINTQDIIPTPTDAPQLAMRPNDKGNELVRNDA
jgi:hypothetical protein